MFRRRARPRIRARVVRLGILVVGVVGLGPLGGAAPGPLVAQAQGQNAGHAEARQHFEAGVRYYEGGDFPHAVEEFLAAYRLAPSPELSYNVARAYERMGEGAEAIRYYRTYLDDPSAQENRAEVERKIAQMEAAAARQQESLRALPPSTNEMTAEARRFFERGVALYRRGGRENYQSALLAFTAAYNFRPLPEIIFNMALTFERLGRAEEAADHYGEYLRRRRDAPDREAVEAKIRTLRHR